MCAAGREEMRKEEKLLESQRQASALQSRENSRTSEADEPALLSDSVQVSADGCSSPHCRLLFLNQVQETEWVASSLKRN